MRLIWAAPYIQTSMTAGVTLSAAPQFSSFLLSSNTAGLYEKFSKGLKRTAREKSQFMEHVLMELIKHINEFA